MTSDRGSGSILAVSILAAIVTAVGLLLPVTAVAVARARASGASDAAALAAADVASGLVPGSPCGAADRVARANGATVSGCSVDGTTVTVEVSVGAGMLVVPGVSTAGQPASDPASDGSTGGATTPVRGATGGLLEESAD